MDEGRKKSISKFISLVLRHEPQSIGLSLDAQGWADVGELLEKSAQHRKPFSREELVEVVRTSEKQRFAFNDAGSRIRANQGHSVDVDLQLKAAQPPEWLYHGTARPFLAAIRSEGLKKMSRQHVHLSPDRATAEKVGSRRGVPVILAVRSGDLHRQGVVFFRSENGVWLTDAVPAEYLSVGE